MIFHYGVRWSKEKIILKSKRKYKIMLLLTIFINKLPFQEILKNTNQFIDSSFIHPSKSHQRWTKQNQREKIESNFTDTSNLKNVILKHDFHLKMISFPSFFFAKQNNWNSMRNLILGRRTDLRTWTQKIIGKPK